MVFDLSLPPNTQVIKESSSLALSWVKTHAYDLRITSNHSEDPLKVPNVVDVHLHLPAGAQKKVIRCSYPSDELRLTDNSYRTVRVPG